MIRKAALIATLALLALALTLTAPAQGPTPTKDAQAGEAVITAELLRAHTTFLSDDLLEGRAPASRGGALAAKYIAAQFERMGLLPGGENGTYFQDVPMLAKKIEPPADLAVSGNGQTLTFKFVDEFLAGSDLEQERVDVSGELVFVGYGITAPEFNWDDFKGADVKGKILLMVVNDPPATAAEPTLFGAKALTYYGRWTYKYESAARRGAAGAILIHTTKSAGYPFQVLQSGADREGFSLPRTPQSDPPLALKSWVNHESAEKIFTLAGKDLAALIEAAQRRDFRPVPLGVRASTGFRQTMRQISMPNVIGLLPGADEMLRDEYVVYTAHYDHLGVGREVNGDGIYNGAADNAVGVAGLLGIAEGMARISSGLKRSQVFAAVAAEESGLLGSAYYAQNPTFPLAQTTATINIDGLNTIGATRDMVLIGDGKSELDEVARIVARERRLQLRPDQFPEQGFFYRSDQFSLAKVGVPALYFDPGLEIEGKPEGYGKQKFDEYVAHDYHQPSDEIKPDWDWQGAVQMARYLYGVGWKIANWERSFEWSSTAEFRAAREESLRKAGRLKK
ncbi:MAG: M28 family peptidase [Terriglobia bacterium]